MEPRDTQPSENRTENNLRIQDPAAEIHLAGLEKTDKHQAQTNTRTFRRTQKYKDEERHGSYSGLFL